MYRVKFICRCDQNPSKQDHNVPTKQESACEEWSFGVKKMATLRGCDRAIMREEEQRSIRHISDLIRSDMEVIPMIGLRNRATFGKSSTTKSSVMVIIRRPCPEEQD